MEDALMNQYEDYMNRLEKNKEVVRNLFASIDRLDFDAVMEILHPDHKLEYPGNDELISREGHCKLIEAHHVGYSDMKHIPEQQISEGDWVVTRGTITGTNDGPLHGNPPTGRKVNVPFINISRIVDGRICGTFTLLDVVANQKQLGITDVVYKDKG